MFITANPYNSIDWTFYNGSGVLIPAHEAVMADPTPNGSATSTLKMAIDPFQSGIRGPFEGVNPVPLIFAAVERSNSAGLIQIMGVSQHDVPSGEWGLFRVWGPTLAKNTATGSLAHLNAYGTTVTVGQLGDVTAGAGIIAVAFQIGTSGATTTGDKRNTFVIAAGCPPVFGAAGAVVVPHGILG